MRTRGRLGIRHARLCGAGSSSSGAPAREYLTEHAPLTLCRAVLESEAAYSDTLWRGVAALGWLGTAIPEEYGGAGFGRLELAAIAEELGHALAPIPFS